MDADEYLTVGEAREHLGVSKPKMARLIADGVLPTETSSLDKRVKLIRRADVEALRVKWARNRPPRRNLADQGGGT